VRRACLWDAAPSSLGALIVCKSRGSASMGRLGLSSDAYHLPTGEALV
jgi:hypothetical protein